MVVTHTNYNLHHVKYEGQEDGEPAPMSKVVIKVPQKLIEAPNNALRGVCAFVPNRTKQPDARVLLCFNKGGGE